VAWISIILARLDCSSKVVFSQASPPGVATTVLIMSLFHRALDIVEEYLRKLRNAFTRLSNSRGVNALTYCNVTS